jgi:exosortase A-associated hydrolase 2
MTETPFYFPNGSYRLFGIFHQPAALNSLLPVVFCHPFGEEKLWAHRVFVSFARQLTRQGYPVLRFDYMGNGDSEGAFNDSSLSTVRSDVECAIDYVRQATGASGVILLGLRWGAMVASLMAEARADILRLILWEPVVDGAAFMQEILRANLSTQVAVYKEIRRDRAELVTQMERGESVNVEGYELALQMYSEVSAVNLAREQKRFAGPCLVTQIAAQRARPMPDIPKLAATYHNVTSTVVNEEPFWKEIPRWYNQAPNLFAGTTDWLNDVGAAVVPPSERGNS